MTTKKYRYIITRSDGTHYYSTTKSSPRVMASWKKRYNTYNGSKIKSVKQVKTVKRRRTASRESWTFF